MRENRIRAGGALAAMILIAGCAGHPGTASTGAKPPRGNVTVTPEAEAGASPDPAAAPAIVAANPIAKPAGMGGGHGMPGSSLGGRALADLLWLHRGNPDSARLALAAYREAALDFRDPALLGRLSRAYYLVANYVETDPALKDSLFLKGVEAADEALSQDSGFARVLRRTHDANKAVQALGLDYIDAIYWHAANLGKWTASKGLRARLGNKAQLEAYNKRVLELDERYFHGAPHRFFGALPTKVPGGDLKAARRHFERAIAIEPNYFGTRTLYAELYAVKARDKATFIKQLDYVLNTPPSALRDAEPENRYEQQVARELKAREREWFD